MPRPLRIEFENAWYHVMNRGARKQPIFLNNHHRLQFLQVLSDACEIYSLEIHAYCLMGNHYHLLVKTPLANLSKCMRHINGVYTQRFNLIEKIDGPLFRGRYKAIVVESNEYLLRVSRYIHLNPVKDGFVRTPEQYAWSSYRDYLSTTPRRDFIHTHELLSHFHNSRLQYKAYHEEDVDPETADFYSKTKQPSIYGDKEFKKILLGKLDLITIRAAKADFNKTHQPPSIEQIHTVCAKLFNVDKRSISHTTRHKKNIPRFIAIYATRKWGNLPVRTIASYYQCNSLSAISNTVKRAADMIVKSTELQYKISRLEQILKGVKYSPYT